jgi:hypothetical protein
MSVRHIVIDSPLGPLTLVGFSNQPQCTNGLTTPVPCATMTTRVGTHVLACPFGIAA